MARTQNSNLTKSNQQDDLLQAAAARLQRVSRPARQGAATTPQATEFDRQNDEFLWVPPQKVKLNPRNFRKKFNPEKISSMAQSMKSEGIGVLKPILVRPLQRNLNVPWRSGEDQEGAEEYEDFDGDNRILAAIEAEIPLIPIRVMNISSRLARRINWIANIQKADDYDVAENGDAMATLRADLEEELKEWVEKVNRSSASLARITRRAKSFRWSEKLAPDVPDWVERIFQRTDEFNAKNNQNHQPRVTWDDVGYVAGLGERAIRYLVKIAKLPDDVKDEISEHGLSGQQARAVATLSDPTEQKRLIREIKRRNLNGEQAMERAKEMAGRKKETVYTGTTSENSASDGSASGNSTTSSTPAQAATSVARPPLGAMPSTSAGSSSKASVSTGATSQAELSTPLQLLREGVRVWSEAASLMENGYSDISHELQVERELELMSKQFERIEAAKKRRPKRTAAEK